MAGGAAPFTHDSHGADGGDEEAQVAAAQADPRAFAPLYERYVCRIYRYCYFRLGSKEAAEDATAEVFLKAVANLNRYRSGVFAAWLYTISRNVVADYRRRASRRLHDAAIAPPADGDDECDRMALLAALERLPEGRRAVIELQCAGWSPEEVAASLRMSPGAVKMARYRAIAQLRALLGQDRTHGGTR